MYRIALVTDLFNGAVDREESHEELQLWLNTLMQMNINFLRRHPQTPYLYQSGVRYIEEPPGLEDWRKISVVLQQMNGDCEDLATWRAAELNVRYGIAARPIFGFRTLPNGDITYHIRVQYPDGKIEDPSRILGMR